MLLFKDVLENLTIISLQTGQKIGVVRGFILNPNDFRIEAFDVAVNRRLSKVLFTSDIKELNSKLAVIDDASQLMDDEDLVRLDGLRGISYELVGKKVRTKSGTKVGKVRDWVFDSQSFDVQKLHLKQKLSKNVATGVTIVDRQQVKELKKKYIVVTDNYVQANAKQKRNQKTAYVRPIQQSAQSE